MLYFRPLLETMLSVIPRRLWCPRLPHSVARLASSEAAPALSPISVRLASSEAAPALSPISVPEVAATVRDPLAVRDLFGVSELFNVKMLFEARMHLGHTVRSLNPQMSK